MGDDDGRVQALNAFTKLMQKGVKKDEYVDEDFNTQRYRPDSIDDLMKKTKFNKKELQTMYRGFKQECPAGVVNEDKFKKIYAEFFPQGDSGSYASYIFHTFDKNGSGLINFEDFVIGLSTLCRGTLRDKIEWSFNLYDLNSDGVITKDEMHKVITSIYEMLGKSVSPAVDPESATGHVEEIFSKMDIDQDGVVSWTEFLEYCTSTDWIGVSMLQMDTIM